LIKGSEGNEKMKVLVTGADGFLGSNIVRELLDRGYETRAFVHPERSNGVLDGLSVEVFRGDILVSDDIVTASRGCDAVIHAAANTSTSPSRSEHVKTVNIKGTSHVIAAVKKYKVGRLVHVGTANSFGFGSRDDPGDETVPYNGSQYKLDYFNSKYEAHRLVLDEVERNGLKAVIVNPTFMIGPFDSKPGFGFAIIQIYHGRVPGFPIGGRNYVHVKDVAVGTVNALTKGRIGECYILGNDNLSYKEIFSMIASVIGVPPPKKTFSPIMVMAYTVFGSIIGFLTGKPPALSLSTARISCDEHYYTSKKALKELELPQTPIETAIEEAFQWFKENGYLER
jgi:dihydroflavonol-4-reductase